MVLKDCSRGMVYTQKGARLTEARVVHTKNSVLLYFADYKLQDARMKSRVDFYDGQAGLIVTVCESVIHRNPDFPEMTEPWMAECRILAIKTVVQRQRDVRAKINLEVSFQSEDQMEFHGTIENLSAGGMFITTKRPLNKDEVISFNYTFRTLAREFKAYTLWGKRIEGGKYGYGCKFIRLTGGAEAAIRSFVYKKLLERQKHKE